MDDSLINSVYQTLYLPNIDENSVKLIEQFMEAYHLTLSEYLNLEVPDINIAKRLQILTGPINAALNMKDDGKAHPAVDLIKQRLESNSKEMEKPFTLSLNNPNAPSLIKDDEQIPNGFSFAIIIVCFTIVIGMVLGALLVLIK